MADAAPEEPLGLREQGKRDRLRRIKEAAYDVFSTHGYDEATTREIAQRAGVSIGTVFTYARDKRELLFLVFNEDLDDAIDRAYRGIRRDQPFPEQLIALFRTFYDYFAGHVTIGRYGMREIGFFNPHAPNLGLQARRFLDRLERVEGYLADLILSARHAGLLAKPGAPGDIGRVLLSVYLIAIRNWIHTDPIDVERGLDDLRRLFRVVVGDDDRGR